MTIVLAGGSGFLGKKLSQRLEAEGHRTITLTRRPSGAGNQIAWLPDGRSTLDLFGKGFVLLRFGTPPAPAGRLADAASSRKVPLAVFDIADAKTAALYERRLVLVRPDGQVCWRADAEPLDTLRVIDTVRGSQPG